MNLKQLLVAAIETGEFSGEVFCQNINSSVEDTDAVEKGVAYHVTQLVPDDQGNLLIQYVGEMEMQDQDEDQ